jgi:CheY-like chemotaxis protein
MSSRGSSIKAPRPPKAPIDLAGTRILIIEDSPVVAPYAVDVLDELGCEVVGPAPNMAAARELVEEGGFDAAIMDVHIRGERVFPLCDLLEAKDVPFILTSGYGDWKVPEKLEDRPRLQKPYTIKDVERALKSLLGKRER